MHEDYLREIWIKCCFVNVIRDVRLQFLSRRLCRTQYYDLCTWKDGRWIVDFSKLSLHKFYWFSNCLYYVSFYNTEMYTVQSYHVRLVEIHICINHDIIAYMPHCLAKLFTRNLCQHIIRMKPSRWRKCYSMYMRRHVRLQPVRAESLLCKYIRRMRRTPNTNA